MRYDEQELFYQLSEMNPREIARSIMESANKEDIHLVSHIMSRALDIIVAEANLLRSKANAFYEIGNIKFANSLLNIANAIEIQIELVNLAYNVETLRKFKNSQDSAINIFKAVMAGATVEMTSEERDKHREVMKDWLKADPAKSQINYPDPDFIG